jgi:hypothetical protein
VKVFISMGMKSKSTKQVQVEMAKVFDYIKTKLPEAQHIDSVIQDADAKIATSGDDLGVWYLGESLKMMSEADIVFFVNDYQDFRGCSIERMVAEKYGKFCVDLKVVL